ncbi:hypothetical protein OSSY52_18790 [Tepiditoga spiralis]|uniref:PPM-type phosphatase domain-containing protein n=1 Tax=Tepiditoga spiralis TaxID=2108365 RepID=A0A7G1G587_9BACT|nr:PP2C family serine/threonine-protein phosphatase [Tepiditoga spiralis]BBE31738.1 hypothetical protein OSSY52_18790 [Tepiditoga spiralis]
MWKTITYEVQGRSHKTKDIPCQDKTYSNYENNVHVIALADGAGSAKFSHYGAEIAVKTISNFLNNNFDNLIRNNDALKVKIELINTLNKKLKEKAQELSCELKSLASTLLVTAIKEDHFIIIHLGDGTIGVIKNNKLMVVSTPANGEYINSTIFTTTKNSFKYIKLFKGKTKDISGFILMSDGTANSFYSNKKKELSNATKKIINWSVLLPKNNMKQLIEETFNNLIINNTYDDCSVAIITNEKHKSNIYNTFQIHEKKEFYDIKTKDPKIYLKKIKANENLLKELYKKQINILELAKKFHIKKRYLKKKLNKFSNLGLIKKENKKYKLQIQIK